MLGSAITFALIATLAVGCTSADTRKQQHLGRGNDYFTKGDYPSALIEYRGALRLDAKFGEARYRLAQTYEKMGDLKKALPEFVRAADLVPDKIEGQLHAGNLLLLTRQFDDAAVRAQNVLERDPKNLDALMLLGSASAHLKDSDKALATLERTIRALPDEPLAHESLGAFEAGRGNGRAAEAAFKRAVEVAPQSIPARQALANYYWVANQADNAERTLKEAVPLDPSGLVIGRDLAILYTVQGRNKEAEPYLVRLTSQSSKDSTLRFALGEIYVRERRFDEALKVYEPLTNDSSTTSLATARMAYAEYGAGRNEKAHRRLREAILRAPKEYELQAMSATLLLADKKVAEAEVAAKGALQIASERFEALYVLGSAMVAQGREAEALPVLQHAATVRPRAIGPKIQLGLLYLNRGEAATALQFAEDAVTLDPNQPLGRHLLTRVLISQHNVVRAEQVLAPLLRAFPNSPEAQATAGDVAFVKGDRVAAGRAYTRALELNPKSVEALTGLVALNVSSQKADAALALVKKSLAANPRDVRILTLAARTYIATKDPKQAEPLLQQAISIAPSSSLEAYGMLAGLYFKQNRLAEAKMQFESMATQQPAAIGPPTMLGIILQLQGKPKDAQAVYERLLLAKPNASIAANNMAMLLVESGGNLDVALNYAQSASKGLPNDADISDTLGLVYWTKGLSSLAASAFEASTRARPNNPEFWLHLGQAYVGSGKKAEAREALQRALKLDSQFTGAATARKLLEDLNKRA